MIDREAIKKSVMFWLTCGKEDLVHDLSMAIRDVITKHTRPLDTDRVIGSDASKPTEEYI